MLYINPKSRLYGINIIFIAVFHPLSFISVYKIFIAITSTNNKEKIEGNKHRNAIINFMLRMFVIKRSLKVSVEYYLMY